MKNRRIACAFAIIWFGTAFQQPGQIVENPFRGITHITRTETMPRNLAIHVVKVELDAPGLRFKLTGPGGSREALRQTTLEALIQERAQIAVNVHFFLPFPSDDPNADLIGLAASEGNVYSGCEKPVQSFALVDDAPAINIDRLNRAQIVRCDERVELWNTVSGSAQIVTNGVVTIPAYKDADRPGGSLTASSEFNYSNTRSWYEVTRARTAIGLTQDNRTLYVVTVDEGEGRTGGMTVAEVANLMVRDYAVYNALNLDGGGSTSLAMEDPKTKTRRLVNRPSDAAGSRKVATSLVIFAAPYQ